MFSLIFTLLFPLPCSVPCLAAVQRATPVGQVPPHDGVSPALAADHQAAAVRGACPATGLPAVHRGPGAAQPGAGALSARLALLHPHDADHGAGKEITALSVKPEQITEYTVFFEGARPDRKLKN